MPGMDMPGCTSLSPTPAPAPTMAGMSTVSPSGAAAVAGASFGCSHAYPMFMGGFGGLTQNGACTLYLFPGAQLDTTPKFVLAWIGTAMLGALLEAVPCIRRRVLGAGALHRAVDASLYAAQVTVGYLVMLVAMTYSAPLFVAIVVGFVGGHAAFTDYPRISGERGERHGRA